MHHLTFWGRFSTYSNQTTSVEACKTVDELRLQLIHEFPELNTFPFTLATSNRILHSDDILEGDEPISVMPPFSGG
jgi:molybdopterin converting factor small subunit